MVQSSEVKTGRIISIRVDHSEDLIEELTRIVKENDINSGAVYFIGALMNPHIVAGPLEPVTSPVLNRVHLKGAWEIVGFGTISVSDEGHVIHLHASLGHGTDSYTGCVRDKARVYLVIEAVIVEFIGILSIRRDDPLTGVKLPFFIPFPGPA